MKRFACLQIAGQISWLWPVTTIACTYIQPGRATCKCLVSCTQALVFGFEHLPDDGAHINVISIVIALKIVRDLSIYIIEYKQKRNKIHFNSSVL
jgi:hypothetical protein